MTDRYAVFGNPVAHSRSPQIHAAFARQTGQDISYEVILAPLDGFGKAVEAFCRAGGRGANVTLPFKQEAYHLAQRCSAFAQAAKAVNTLSFEGDSTTGHNTDGIGLLADLKANLHCAIRDRRVLLLGAGGAARGVILPLLQEQPRCLVIANRTAVKALDLRAEFLRECQDDARLEACALECLPHSPFDLVINATSASLVDAVLTLPAGIYAQGSLAYDMAYGKASTPFLAAAQLDGATYLADGLGMLVEQAAESFRIWRGVRPETASVLRLLRAE